MKCNNCGNEFEGNFCDKCGTAVQEKETRFEQKIKESFVEPEENLVDILGTNTAKTFFSTGVLGNGFAVLSDKRMYFKGRCYVRAGKGFFKKMEERVVDLNDITGTGFVHNKNIITTILYYVAFAISCAIWFSWPFWGIYYATGKQWAKKVAWGIQCIFWMMPLFYIIYKAFNYSLFEVSYAGGGIAFDLSWITKADSDNFQKTLQKAKSDYKKKMQEEQKYQYVPPIDNMKQEKSVPEQLKEYKELLDSGIITQEEFDTKKKELLTK